MPRRLNVLMADESVVYAERVVEALRRDGYEGSFERVERAAEMAAALERQHWDLILASDGLPGFPALSALGVLREHGLKRPIDIPLIVISKALDANEAHLLDLPRCRD